MTNQHEDKIEFDSAAIERLPEYDPADYLKSKESVINFLNDFLEEDDSPSLVEALMIAARAVARTEFDGSGSAALARKDQEPESVPIPTSVNMARLMLALSYKWLKENAPQHVPAQEPAIPEGYALVPLEPTVEMIAALAFGGDVDLVIGHAAISNDVIDDYKAMLAAAGVAPQESAKETSHVPT